MPVCRLGLGILFAAVLLVDVMGAACPARAQSDAELKALNEQVQQLHKAAKYQEAIAVAGRYVEAAKRKHGEEGPEYAIAISWLAQLLNDTNQLAEAEPLMRRALAIDEKSFGTEHPNVATRLNNLAGLLHETNRLAEAEPLYRRALAINERSFGPEHSNVARDLNNLAQLLKYTNRLAEAEPLMRRVIAVLEKALGNEHPNVAAALNNLAGLLHDTNRLVEAEPLMRRALAIDEKSFGPEHPNVARKLNNLAVLLQTTNRLAEAEPLYRRVIAIFEKALGAEHPNVAAALNNLAQLLKYTNRLAEAEPLYRRALAIDEKSFGPEHPNVATRLNNLAGLLYDTNRLAEAESLYDRVIAILEKALGAEHPNVAAALNNLAGLFQDTNRLAEAEPLYRRALSIQEKSFGPEHPNVATALNNLAGLFQDTNRLAEAEPLYRRALAIDEASFGPEHPSVAIHLNNLAWLLQETNRLAEAEPLYRRALSIDGKSFGPEHPKVAATLNNLGYLRAELGDWAEATRLHRRAKPIMTGAHGKEGDGLSKAPLTRHTGNLRASARAVHRSGGGSAAAREEGFEVAQWALQTGAADALAQMSVRFAKGAGPLSQLVRERQDLISRRQGDDKRLLAAVGAADAKAAAAMRGSIDDIDRKLEVIDKQLTAEFADYASLANPKPLTIAAVQELLKADEALVLFLDVPRTSRLPEETLAWTMTKTEARWISISLGTEALAERVAKLRCGLDREGSWAWAGRAQRWLAKSERCRELKPDGLGVDEPLPFDLKLAHELYTQLLGPFADLTRDKSLIIVPSGPLTSLPFHVLVTEPPKVATFRSAAWLALKQAITVLPSVGSLQALRKLPPSEAKEPYIAFGNPLLDGTPPNGEPARLARAKQACPQDLESQRQRVAAAAQGIPGLGTIFRGGSIDVAALRAQAPLPETADELCAVAKALGALGRERDTVWLGARATETNLKALSREGKLARYRVLHFATHGLLAGESEVFLKAKAEPALLLNPPKEGASETELEHDNGLLTASEVAQLQLDADWVVLSACNTAAGDKGDAEAFAGLARAFFYAKARALLVSHWYVISDAAVKLTTGTFAQLRANPKEGRAEALRRSMAALIAGGRPSEAHPDYWAPFVLVGEGAG